MHQAMRSALSELGLTKNEIEVYLALSRLGSSTSGMITKESGLHRRNVYDSLEKLSRRGLVSQVKKNNIMHFETANPKRLLESIKEKRKALELNEAMLNKFLPDMLDYRESRYKQDVCVFFGKEGRRILFEDILENAKENLVLGGFAPSAKSQNYMKVYNRARSKRAILNKMIYNKKHKYLDFLKSLDYTEIRLMPKELSSRVSFNIYNNNVAILFKIDENPVTILIKNGKVANDFRQYFSVLWDLSNPY